MKRAIDRAEGATAVSGSPEPLPPHDLSPQWAPARTYHIEETRRRLVLDFCGGAAFLALLALPLFAFGVLDTGSSGENTALLLMVVLGGLAQVLVYAWTRAGRSVQAAGFATVTVMGVSCVSAAVIMSHNSVLATAALMFLAVPIMLSGSVLEQASVRLTAFFAAASIVVVGWLLYPLYGIAIILAPLAAVLSGSYVVQTNSAVAHFMDVRDAEHRAEEVRLEMEACTDELTGLLNRRGFMVAAERELDLAHRQGVGVTLIYLDLDDMKAINDEHGHMEGDEALRRAADLLRITLRSSDLVARIGGDEFAAFAVQTPDAEIHRFPSRLGEAMERHNAETASHVAVHLSYGIVYAPVGDQRSIRELLSNADELMYEAKAARGHGRMA